MPQHEPCQRQQHRKAALIGVHHTQRLAQHAAQTGANNLPQHIRLHADIGEDCGAQLGLQLDQHQDGGQQEEHHGDGIVPLDLLVGVGWGNFF